MTVSWNWLWYVLVGFILGGGAVYLGVMLKEKSIKLNWYEWILVLISFVLVLFLAQTFIASIAEGEVRAAWMSVIFLGFPTAIVIVGALRLVNSRIAKA